MTALTPPSSDAPAAEWGCFAVSISDWRWMPGMRYFYGGFSASTGASEDYVDRLWQDDAGPYDHAIFPAPDPDDPATEGCLVRLLGCGVYAIRLAGLEPDGTALWQWHDPTPDDAGEQWSAGRLPLGRACIAAAAANGGWPGGDQ